MSSGMRDAYSGRMFGAQKGNAPHDAAEEYATLTDAELLRTAAAWVQTASPDNPYAKALSNELAQRAARRPSSERGSE